MKSKVSNFGFAAVVFAAITVSSCASRHDAPDVHYDPASMLDDQLGKAAQQAANAQSELARIQTARTTPTPSALDETSLPEELKRPATLEWSGPAHEAARKLAALVGYSFQITGNPPSIPPVIQVSLHDVPAAKALEQVGLQAFPFGEVSVDPNAKRIEFRYLQAQQQPISPKGTSPNWGK